MISVTLMGGMGNQMFQYSLGRSLSIKNNLPMNLDLFFLNRRDFGPNFVYRNYDLDIFNIRPEFGSGGEVVKEPHFQYSEDIHNLVVDKHINIEGYWQTPKYFSNIESIIRNDFQFVNLVTESDLLNSIRNSNSVMINVRRTDYLNTDFHGVMGNDYIMRAVDIIESKIENPTYFIFSDDVEWCKENIHLKNMTIVDHSYAGEKFNYYLQLMISCKHFIIPNSSFAWWSAWLNTNTDKIVISPKNWFNMDIDTSDLIPDNWIRI
jgi:hypothetical protein